MTLGQIQLWVVGLLKSYFGIGGGSGVPTAPTASLATNTTQIATTAFVLANATTSITVGTTVFTGGTTGSVLFVGAGSVVQQNNANLFWDNTNGRLGIGTAAPTGSLSFPATISPTPQIRFIHPLNAADAAFSTYYDASGTEIVFGTNLYINSGARAVFTAGKAFSGAYLSNTGEFRVYTGAAGDSIVAKLVVNAGGDLSVTPAARTSGSPTAITLTGGAHTTLAASTEAIDVNINLARTVQFATGALTTQRAMVVQGQTIAFVGGSTCATAVTLDLPSAPIAGTNATITNAINLRANTGTETGVGIVAKCSSITQTGHPFEVQNSAGTPTAYFTGAASAGASGRLFTGIGSISFPNLMLTATNTGFWCGDTVNIYVAAGGTDLFGIKTNAIQAASNIGFGWGTGGPSAVGPDTLLTRSAVSVIKATDGSTGLGAFICGQPATGTIGLSVQGIASRTAALLNLQTSAGASLGNVGGSTFNDFTDTSSTSTDGTEDDLYSYTTVANTFAINGDAITEIEHAQFVSSATATRRLKKYFAGTLIFDSGALTLTLGGDFFLETTVIRESSTVVRVSVNVVTTSASSVPYATYTRITGLTLTSTNIIKTTGIAAGAGAASADIKNKLSKITTMPAA